MKTLTRIGFILMMLVSASFGIELKQWEMELSSPTRIIPMRDPAGHGRTVTPWTNGIVTTAGDYYSNTDGTVYFAITAGTSTNEPVLAYVDTTSDAVQWLKCRNVDWKRGITVCVLEGSELHYNINAPATTGCPYLNNRTFTGNNCDGEYFAIPNSGTSKVSIIIQ